jgi:hypothetical protein
LLYTKASGPWTPRPWETGEARVDASAGTVSATLPPDATAYFLNLIDAQGRVVSTPHSMADESAD